MKNIDTRLLAVVSLSVLLASLGTSIINIALPSFVAHFSVSFQIVQWVVIAYLLSMTVFVTVAGKLIDTYGYRQVLLFGIALLTLSSFLSACVPYIQLLIALRALQGIGAAILSTVSMVMVKNNTRKEMTGTAMGLMGTMSAVGTAMGPSAGGVLLSNFGWQSIFLFLGFLGICTGVLGLKYISKEKHTHRERVTIPFADVLLLSLTVGVYAITMTISKNGVSIYTGILLLSSILLGRLFFLRQRYRKHPLIDISILTHKKLMNSLLGNFIIASVMMSTLIIGPFFLTSGLGLKESTAGWIMSVGPFVSILSGIPSGKIVDRAGAALTIHISLFLFLSGTLSLALLPAIWGGTGYITGILLLTPGYQLFQASNNTLVMSMAKENQAGIIAGILNLFRNTGLITGASLMGTIFNVAAKKIPGVHSKPEAMFLGLKSTFLFASLLILLFLLKQFVNRR